MRNPSVSAADRSSTTPLPESLLALKQQLTELEAHVAPETADTPLKIAVLRNITVEAMEPILRFRFLEDGTPIEIAYGGYGTLLSDLLSADSPIAQVEQDILLTALTLEQFDPRHGVPGWRCDGILQQLDDLLASLDAAKARTIIVNNFPLPAWPAAGGRFLAGMASLDQEVMKINAHLEDRVRARKSRIILMDWARLSRQLGDVHSFDRRYGYLYTAPLTRTFFDAVAREVRTVHRAQTGKTKKCLVLDCDNTLWGGIVGEDGIEGIALSGFDYPGRAYFDFQKSVLHLYDRGILVCLCSKNEERDVFEVLDDHPWSLLRRDHLAAHRINWKGKAENIRSLAEELNLGLDAFVFLDDNPREVDEVRTLLPDVATLIVPSELHEYPTLLQRASWFDKLRVGEEDRLRTRVYQDAKLREDARERSASLEDHLASLDQRATIHAAKPTELGRVAELVQKTNQFNMTTRRYTYAEIEGLATSASSRIYTLAAEDRFGPLGLVGVMILRDAGRITEVDSFLMSCRALGRGLEACFARWCLDVERSRPGLERFRAPYRPTAKNGMISGFWEQLGFDRLTEEPEEVLFEINAAALDVALPKHIALETETLADD